MPFLMVLLSLTLFLAWPDISRAEITNVTFTDGYSTGRPPPNAATGMLAHSSSSDHILVQGEVNGLLTAGSDGSWSSRVEFDVTETGWLVFSSTIDYEFAENPVWSYQRVRVVSGFNTYTGTWLEVGRNGGTVSQVAWWPTSFRPVNAGSHFLGYVQFLANQATMSGDLSIHFYRATPEAAEPASIPDYAPGGSGGQMYQPNANHCVWIVHGMNDKIILNDAKHWASQIKANEFSAGNSVYTWDWRQNAQADLLSGARSGLLGVYTVAKEIGTAYRNATFEGVALAKDIKQRVATSECQLKDVRLIGHSYGGVVAAVAADILSSDYGEKRDELVLIDTPNLSFLDAVSHVNLNSATKIINLFGGRWEGAVGGPIDGTNVWNLGVDLPGRGMLPNPFFFGHIQMPNYWPGIRDSIQNWVANQPAGVYHEVYLPGGNGTSFRFGSPDYIHNHAPLFLPQTVLLRGPVIESLQEWRGYGARLVEYANRLAVELDESAGFGQRVAAALEQDGVGEFLIPPAMIHRSLTIPESAEYMRFEFAVPIPADGDRLVVSFAGTRLFETPLFGTQDDFVLTPPIYVGDLPTDEH
jgi:pimeloyl-ACP methyl ester carboxylesterase